MKSRNYAVINEDILLEYNFYKDGRFANISEWTKIEIYDDDPRLNPSANLIQTIYPVDIINVSTGKYQAIMSAVLLAKNYYDKQTYKDWDDIEQIDYDIIPVRLAIDEGRVRKLQGFSYNNPDVESNNGWGRVVTPDEIRNIYLFGNPMISPDGQTIQDSALELVADKATAIVERDLNITLVKRIFKARGPNGAERTDVEGNAGLDWEYEEPYDFERNKFNNRFIYMKLRNRPILKVNKVEFRDPLNNLVSDITSWCKPNFERGSLEFFPNYSNLNMMFLQSSWFAMGNFLNQTETYPDAFYIDYDAGFESVLYMRKKFPELFEIIGMVAFIIAAEFVGDGRLAAIASSSISMEGISESYSTTMSASIDYHTYIPFINGKEKIGKMFKNKNKYINNFCISINPKTCKVDCKQILNIIEHDTKNKKCFKLYLENKKTKIITEDHSLFIIKDNKLKEIKGYNLKKNDYIAFVYNNKVKNLKIKKIKEIKRNKMYDLSVMDYENFVDEDGIIFHNTSAMFGARLLSYQKVIKDFYQRNRWKYSGIQVGCL